RRRSRRTSARSATSTARRATRTSTSRSRGSRSRPSTPTRRRSGRSGGARAKRQKRRLELTIPVTEGDRWKLGTVTIEGNKVYSDEILLRAFARPRSPWLRASAGDKGVQAIEGGYRHT